MTVEIARVREQWGGVIQTVIAACQGNANAAAHLPPFLEELEQKGDWRGLAVVLRRIVAGEREPLSLLRGLDETDTLIAGDILRGLGIAVPFAQDREEEDDGRMVSLDQFVQRVGQACRPDAPADLVEQMQAATRGMAMQPNAAPEVRELGQILNAILSGERNPNLASLPPQFAEAVKTLLSGVD